MNIQPPFGASFEPAPEPTASFYAVTDADKGDLMSADSLHLLLHHIL